MIANAAIALCLLFALLSMIAAARSLRRRRVLGGMVSGLSGALFLALAAIAALFAGNLHTYQRLTYEQPAGEITFHQTAPQAFDGVLTYPNGEHAAFALRGDEWQIDARVLKWKGIATLVGFDAAYRLERIGGRYARVEDERTQPHTVFDLAPAEPTDVWTLVKRYHGWLPWVDALYGSATYLPMADGALFDIRISQSGLLARPLNAAARDTVAAWH